MSAFDATLEPERVQLEAFIEDTGRRSNGHWNSLTDEQARRQQSSATVGSNCSST